MDIEDFIIKIQRTKGETTLEIDVEDTTVLIGALATLIYDITTSESDAYQVLNMIGGTLDMAYKKNLAKSK